MNIMGVTGVSNNYAENMNYKQRTEIKKQDEQSLNMLWLQKMYEVYSRHLMNFEDKFKVVKNIKDAKELTSLIQDAKQRLSDIKSKMDSIV